MHPVLVIKNTGEKARGVGKKSVFSSFFSRPEDRKFVEKMRSGASYSTSKKLLLVARHIVFKVGSVKMANSLSLPSIVKKVRIGSKSSQVT